jgi:ACS family D-galactonate transporter-like MFS transporter
VLITWFPRSERARANSIDSVGMYAGIGFFSPDFVLDGGILGLAFSLLVVGAVGIVFGIVWLQLYRDPTQHPGE